MAGVRDDLAAEPEPIGDHAHTAIDARPRRNRRWRLALGGVLLVLLAAILAAWIARERLLRDYLTDRIARAGLPATFRVVSVGTGATVLADVVVGDPARPDLTIARVEVSTTTGWGIPGLGEIRVVRPRLRGSYRDGVLSFGSLDKLLFAPAPSGQPAGLPDLNLALEDARATIALDRGRADVFASGRGGLRDGFAGRLRATASEAGLGACDLRGIAFDAKVRVTVGKPRIAGPLRLAGVVCPAAGIALGPATAGISATVGPALDTVEGALVARGSHPRFPGGDAAALRGTVRLSLGAPGTSVRYDLSADAPRTAQLAARTAELDGVLRVARGSAHVITQGRVSARGVVPGPQPYAALDRTVRTSSGSFAAALLGRMRGALRCEAPASTLVGEYLVRHDASYTSFGVPRLEWRSARGEPLASLSGVQGSITGVGLPSLAGRFATDGPDMPRLSGTVARDRDGFTLRATMARYDAGTASAALPQLMLVGLGGDSIGIAGEARISGDLPGGGATRGLVLPITGSWTRRGGLTLWPRCTQIGFDTLRLANLTLDARRLQLCPPRGGAIVRSDARGTRIAAGAPALALTGRLGTTPVRLSTGAVGFAMPGALAARGIDVALGPAGQESRFRIASLDARIGRDIAGRFAGSQVRLAAVPLDLVDVGGTWRFTDGRLTLTDGALRLVDREPVARFQPLVARGATLTLAGNRIVADALLREPASDRAVIRAHIGHDLARGQGSADLAVDALTFDKQVQPDTLTRLALGVVANAAGTVRGTGRIDWSPRGVTSSGRFITDGLDLAAAFGPAKGVSGTIVFTDLLGLVTAPHQALRIASVNPGIEARDGVLNYALRPGTSGQHVLSVEGARWPFLGGTLMLEPAATTIGVAETRRFTLVIEALDAARLVQQMDLDNLAVTGVFDGRLPLVIDQDGSRIEGGTLLSRPPGGNVSYVGALTYKDLSPMANFAFDALKSLDYRQMSVGVDGALTGELVTRLRFSGVTQGKSAKRNFLTERIGRLPIQFNVNVRAPFVQLISSFRSLWDPAYVRDPRELGLIGPDGKPRSPATAPPVGVQPSASEPVR